MRVSDVLHNILHEHGQRICVKLPHHLCTFVKQAAPAQASEKTIAITFHVRWNQMISGTSLERHGDVAEELLCLAKTHPFSVSDVLWMEYRARRGRAKKRPGANV